MSRRAYRRRLPRKHWHQRLGETCATPPPQRRARCLARCLACRPRPLPGRRRHGYKHVLRWVYRDDRTKLLPCQGGTDAGCGGQCS